VLLCLVTDGAKDKPCEIIIYGIGPATTTRVGGQ